MKKARSRKLHYVDVLPSEPIPAGSYLVHNHIRPVKPLGLNGFRAWIQTDADNLVKCRCNFGGCKNSKLHRLHYRVGRTSTDSQGTTTIYDASGRKVGSATRK